MGNIRYIEATIEKADVENALEAMREPVRKRSACCILAQVALRKFPGFPVSAGLDPHFAYSVGPEDDDDNSFPVKGSGQKVGRVFDSIQNYDDPVETVRLYGLVGEKIKLPDLSALNERIERR